MRIIACLIASLVAFRAAAQSQPATTEATALYTQAIAAYEAKDYAKSIELGLASIEKGARRGTVPYHVACCYALTGKKDDAFKYLKIAFERGWRDLDHMTSDADLATLHGDARWKDALAACEAARDAYFKTLKEPALARELMDRMARDQRLRRELEKRMREQPDGQKSVPTDSLPPDLRGDIDGENTQFMKKVIDRHGWPGKSLVGEEAANAAWLLVQHADADREFQNRCLGLIKAAFDKGEVTGQQVAYLTDRVLVGQGRKQVYGTQFRLVDGEMQPAPIEDEANVDVRRKEVGLPPLADYARMIRGQR